MQESPEQYTKRLLSYRRSKDPLRLQESTPKALARLIAPLNKKQLSRRPVRDKWSIAEILSHLADAELVIGYRIRLILTSNGTAIQAFDQDAWAQAFHYRRGDARISLETFRTLREGNLKVLKMVPRRLWQNYGQHQERGNESVEHLVNLVAGHDVNHLMQVQAIAKGGR